MESTDTWLTDALSMHDFQSLLYIIFITLGRVSLAYTCHYKAMQEIPDFSNMCQVLLHHLTTSNQAYMC